MSLVSCSQVLSTAGKPRIPLRQSRPYKPRACNLFRLSLRVDPFHRWPVVKRLRSTHRLQLRVGSSIKPEFRQPRMPHALATRMSNIWYHSDLHEQWKRVT